MITMPQTLDSLGNETYPPLTSLLCQICSPCAHVMRASQNWCSGHVDTICSDPTKASAFRNYSLLIAIPLSAALCPNTSIASESLQSTQYMSGADGCGTACAWVCRGCDAPCAGTARCPSVWPASTAVYLSTATGRDGARCCMGASVGFSTRGTSRAVGPALA